MKEGEEERCKKEYMGYRERQDGVGDVFDVWTKGGLKGDGKEESDNEGGERPEDGNGVGVGACADVGVGIGVGVGVGIGVGVGRSTVGLWLECQPLFSSHATQGDF